MSSPAAYVVAWIIAAAVLYTAAILIARATYAYLTRVKDDHYRRRTLEEYQEDERKIMEAWKMKTLGDIRDEVIITLGDYVDDFDVDGIIDDLENILELDARAGYASIDTIEQEAYNAILQRHDTTI